MMRQSRISTHTCEIIAHRGASGEYPENTAAAFHAAIQQGADRIEFDVQCTKDNVPVIVHDPVHVNYNQLPSDVLTLEEAMKICTIPVNIEIKDPRCVQRVVSVIREDVIVSCSDPEVLTAVQQCTSVDCELVCDNDFKKYIPLARHNNFKGVNVPADKIDEWLLNGIGLYKLRVKAYTVNDQEEAKKLLQLGISGIFTDYPERIRLIST